MDDTEDDARSHPNRYALSNRHKLPIDHRYEDDDESDDDINGADQPIGDDPEDDEDEDEDGIGSSYRRERADDNSSPDSRGKRQKLEKFVSGFEFAPRPVATTPLSAIPPLSSRPPVRHSPADWSEDATSVLLDAWGVLYVQNGRKSLRSDEWAEVAKKVNAVSRTPRTDAQCRNRLDTLKKKYKKEKARMAESISSSSSWVHFKKMEELMGLPTLPPVVAARPQVRLPCGVDSGEYVFPNSRGYAGLSEMPDSPVGSELMGEEDEDDESDGLPPQTTKKGKGGFDSSSFRMLAESIQKFGEIYEKMESSKRQHMLELERMRRDFHRDLEMQKRQILDRAQEEIEKLGQEDDDDSDDDDDGDVGEHRNGNVDIDGSAENTSI